MSISHRFTGTKSNCRKSRLALEDEDEGKKGIEWSSKNCNGSSCSQLANLILLSGRQIAEYACRGSYVSLIKDPLLLSEDGN